jgi:hypothetical protein
MKILSSKLEIIMTEKHYSIQWLDFIITTLLHVSETDTPTLTAQQHQTLTGKVHEEKLRYIAFLNEQRLRLSSKRKLRHLIDQQHGKLLTLLDRVHQNAALSKASGPMTISAMESITCCIYELLTFIEDRLASYVCWDQPAGPAYLSQVQKELAGRIKQIHTVLSSHTENQTLTGILLKSLMDVSGAPGGRAITFREIFYKKELLAGLEKISHITDQHQAHQALLELLVYLNFNSRSFQNYYTQMIAQHISRFEPAGEKLSQLLLSYKHFEQMHKKAGIMLHPQQADLKTVIGDWFAQEISYLEKISQWDMASRPHSLTACPTQKPEPFKVIVLLSVDQIGLILRALDSVRVLKAKSLNAVFESITPFLSTPRKPEISWESMRSKSYTFEEKDKQTVIKVLQAVIDWINEY